MKGLAIYTLIIAMFECVSMLIQVLQGIEISINVWGIVITIPMVVFAIMYLKKREEE